MTENGCCVTYAPAHDLSAARPGWAEGDSAAWWMNAVAAVRRLRDQVSLSAVGVGGVSGTVPALVLLGASVQGRVAFGPRAGARVRRPGEEPDLGHAGSRGPRQAQLDGFDLHANVWAPSNDRARLERLCRLCCPSML